MAKATSKKAAAVKSGGKSAVKASAKHSVKPHLKAPAKPQSKAVKSVKFTKPVVKKATTKSKLAPTASRPAAVAAAKNGKPVAAAAKAPLIPSKALKAMAKSPAADKFFKLGKRDGERRGFAIATPVPTDMKPAKNQMGLRSAELEHFRDMLLAKRRELVGDMSSMEHEALQRGGSSNLSNLPLHMADMGTDNYEQEFTLGLMEKDRNLLREINSALAKIQDGTYGLCEGTGKPIGKPRLEAQPWARYSIDYARKIEQRGVR